MCILEWRIVLTNEVFNFFAQKIYFSFYKCQTRGFCEEATTNVILVQTMSTKIVEHFYLRWFTYLLMMMLVCWEFLEIQRFPADLGESGQI
jgi:hypothetical protein